MDFQQELTDYPGYVAHVNESLPLLLEYFTFIKALKDKPCTDENFNNAFQSFVKVFEIIPMMVSFIEVPQIVRGRVNTDETPFFSEEWEISYNSKFADFIKLGRFNQEAEPLFYGSLPTENKQEDYLLSCALECCKELSDLDRPVDVQDITIGGWLIKKPIAVF